MQKSPIRCFEDALYEETGALLVDDVSDCDVVFGVKEVPYDMLAEGKTMLFFSHTIKKQSYNRTLLQEVLRNKVRLIDYETLTYPNGFRVLGFGRYAGIVGAYNALIAYGKRFRKFDLKPAYQCEDMKEMGREMKKVGLGNAKIIISGGGKVANGAKETMDAAGVRQVTIPEFLNEEFEEAVYCNADILDYHEVDGKPPENFMAFVKDSTAWKNTFIKFTKVADIFISAHFWDNQSDAFFRENDVKSDDFRVRVIADITCDIKGSVPTTLRASTIKDPIYGYNRFTGEEAEPYEEDSITVMAVDNLPCEVPKDASSGFGDDLIDKVIPLFMGDDPDEILARATIAENGQLTKYFSYLQEYVAGKS